MTALAGDLTGAVTSFDGSSSFATEHGWFGGLVVGLVMAKISKNQPVRRTQTKQFVF